MPKSRWSDYHLLLQHKNHMYSVDNRWYENLFIIQHILYIISYVQIKHCLRDAAPIGLFWNKNLSMEGASGAVQLPFSGGSFFSIFFGYAMTFVGDYGYKEG